MNYSIAICTFNGQVYLAQQLESILNQSIPPNEIVLCDDGSVDDTLSIAQNISLKYPNVIWQIISNTNNLGYTKNFEKAISLCNSEIIILSDQDDVWLPNKADKLISFLKKSGKSVVFSNAKLVDSNLMDLEITMFDKVNFIEMHQEIFYKKHFASEIFLSRSIATGATMAFYKKHVLNFFPIPTNNIYIHDSWIATCAACTDSIGFLDEALTLYRQHSNQSIGAKVCNDIYLNDFDRLNQLLRFMLLRNETVLKYLIENKNFVGEKKIKRLKEKNVLLERLISSKDFLLKRLFAYRPKLYLLQVNEFETLRKFVGNWLIYIKG